MALPESTKSQIKAPAPSDADFRALSKTLTGELFYSNTPSHLSLRKVYATDASIYQELPRAVLIPKTKEDIQKAVQFADHHAFPIIPRAAGTSLAGQVVGSGLVVDVSKYMNEIVEVNVKEKWVRVQPGVIRDDLNLFLKNFQLQFGPETSTASRAMIGGMIGNNSCGLHSLVWGSTRDHLLEVEAIMSNGEIHRFSRLTKAEWEEACSSKDITGEIYSILKTINEDPDTCLQIRNNFPDPSVKRRNSGYALDALLDDSIINRGGVNLCKIIAGSEGTLCFITEAKLALMDLPTNDVALVAVHCNSIHEALLANKVAVGYECAASELVDEMILDYARQSPRYAKEASFVQGNPKAILLVEFIGRTMPECMEKARQLIRQLTASGFGYAYPILEGEATNAAWELRKAGLGLIRNLPGDAQPVNLIEDGAVSAEKLPEYIDEVSQMLDKYGIRFCIYAHAGPGELHIEPILNLKTDSGRKLMRKIATETALLLKKYRGALSGEHGDGRLRGEFIPLMMGEEVYELFRKVKNTFDPKGIFNRCKILDTPPMDTMLRYEQDKITEPLATLFDFSAEESMLRLTEKCSGSGDCRRSSLSGGLMCPSYMATRAEKDTTRARANILRQFITRNEWDHKRNADEVMEILDLCLSCKGCKTECPSNVDISKLKAEFTQQYHDRYGSSIRSRRIARFSSLMKRAYPLRHLFNMATGWKAFQRLMNPLAGFHPERSIPKMASTRFTTRWEKSIRRDFAPHPGKGTVHFFVDEFSEYTDASIAETAVHFMLKLGYVVQVHGLTESGRALLSKGFIREAAAIANANVRFFSAMATEKTPLVGIEPSAILSFRDEYPSLVSEELRDTARELATHSMTFVEWVFRELQEGRISASDFNDNHANILLHEHCHQKALGETNITQKVLSIPPNHHVELIPSGCCGMAGSFGYEKEHYDLSMQIGELVLFPKIRSAEKNTVFAASGTSCRHQILDGTDKKALHPAEILFNALRN